MKNTQKTNNVTAWYNATGIRPIIHLLTRRNTTASGCFGGRFGIERRKEYTKGARTYWSYRLYLTDHDAELVNASDLPAPWPEDYEAPMPTMFERHFADACAKIASSSSSPSSEADKARLQLRALQAAGVQMRAGALDITELVTALLDD